ncbi:MAG: T9SS type A sorting domain-containing protein, partial [Fluviicola sp.]
YNINQEPLGLEDSKLEAIYMYPNPAADKIQFSGASIREVAIYDMAGKQVLEVSNILNNEVSLNNLQSGIYQVILKSENSISNQKLVIKK